MNYNLSTATTTTPIKKPVNVDWETLYHDEEAFEGSYYEIMSTNAVTI